MKATLPDGTVLEGTLDEISMFLGDRNTTDLDYKPESPTFLWPPITEYSKDGLPKADWVE